MIINDLELADVSSLLHDLQKFDDNPGRRSDHDLSLSSLLSVGDVFEGIVENTDMDHGL